MTKSKFQQVVEQSEESYEYEELELAGKQEFIATDTIASYKVFVGKKPVGLDYFISKKEGGIKSSFTLFEARALAMRPDWNPFTRTKDARIPREVVLDELADHFQMSEQELIDHIEELAEFKPKARKRTSPKVRPPVAVIQGENIPSILFTIALILASRKLLKIRLKF